MIRAYRGGGVLYNLETISTLYTETDRVGPRGGGSGGGGGGDGG